MSFVASLRRMAVSALLTVSNFPNLVRVVMLCGLLLFTGGTFAQAGGDQSSATQSSQAGRKSAEEKSSSKKVNVNSATKEELTATGIDEAAAQKIIDGRPYKTKRDLVIKHILSEDEYNKVKDMLVARRRGENHRKKNGQGPCPPDCK